MKLAHPQGLLFIIGGGEDKEGDCTILAEFVRLAGGGRARLVVMTVATDEPEEVGREYRKVFRRLGAKSMRVVDVSARSDASDRKRLAALEQATGIFFTGGDQLHVTSLIGGSEMDLLLHRLYEQGVVIGGASAGCATSWRRPSNSSARSLKTSLTRSKRNWRRRVASSRAPNWAPARAPSSRPRAAATSPGFASTPTASSNSVTARTVASYRPR